MNEFLQNLDSLLQQSLERYCVEPQLREAAAYMLFPGGKRIRPQVCYALYTDLVGKQSATTDLQSLLALAAAIELLHVSSLIHDDLPALDNDDYRRGKFSCHKQFSEARAILTGDMLITLAFQVLLSATLDKQAQVSQCVARAFNDLCAGQSLDLAGLDLTAEKTGEAKDSILKMYALKTGALFAASCSCTFLLAQSTSQKQEVFLSQNTLEQDFYSWGQSLGVSFQVADDFKDMHASSQIRGRPESSDLRNNKQGYLFGKSKCEAEAELKNRVQQLIAEYKNLLANLTGNTTSQLNLVLLLQQNFV